jgi:hypothetical protein
MRTSKMWDTISAHCAMMCGDCLQWLISPTHRHQFISWFDISFIKCLLILMYETGVTIHGLDVQYLTDHQFKIITQFAPPLHSYMHPLLRRSNTINHCICACALLARMMRQCNESLSEVQLGSGVGEAQIYAAVSTDLYWLYFKMASLIILAWNRGSRLGRRNTTTIAAWRPLSRRALSAEDVRVGSV